MVLAFSGVDLRSILEMIWNHEQRAFDNRIQSIGGIYIYNIIIYIYIYKGRFTIHIYILIYTYTYRLTGTMVYSISHFLTLEASRSLDDAVRTLKKEWSRVGYRFTFAWLARNKTGRVLPERRMGKAWMLDRHGMGNF